MAQQNSPVLPGVWSLTVDSGRGTRCRGYPVIMSEDHRSWKALSSNTVRHQQSSAHHAFHIRCPGPLSWDRSHQPPERAHKDTVMGEWCTNLVTTRPLASRPCQGAWGQAAKSAAVLVGIEARCSHRLQFTGNNPRDLVHRRPRRVLHRNSGGTAPTASFNAVQVVRV
jgi:hypothetical protein